MTRLLLLIFVVLIAACAGPKPTGPLPLETDYERALAEDAEALLSRGEFSQAAALYSRLAQRLDPPRRHDYQLQAADALARGELLVQARQLVGALPHDELDPSQRFQVRLVQARILIQERRPQEVLELFAATPEPRFAPELMARFHGLRADALTMQGRRVETARELVWREAYLVDGEAIRANQYAIWQTLGTLSEAALEAQRRGLPADDLSGWMDLVRIVKRYQLQPPQMHEQLLAWQQMYPTHPVLGEIVESLLQRREEAFDLPEHIALLLPFSGRFAQAAEAVRNGFLAAYYHQPEARRLQQQVRLYDAGNNPLAVYSAYQRAVENGAQFVVGPLDKDAVNVLAQLGELPVPTLALNYSTVETAPPAGLYQFGLLPEEEARQVAERTWLDGHVYAAALYPKSEWGQRVYAAFRNRWEELGGTVVQAQTYDPARNDFSDPIRRLLSIDESQTRYRALARIAGGSLNYTPRRRQDIDFVFVAGYPRQARQLAPQLKFHHAGDLPVYATSHVFAGQLDREMDRDMNGLVFGDMPWVLGADPAGRSLHTAVEQFLTPNDRGLQRLYALGVDAFNILTVLDPLARYPYERYQGETGSLSLDHEGRIHRELTWVRFIGGRPVPLDSER